MTEFERRLAEGRVAEGLIAGWLKARGNAVLPAYEIEKSSGKGPQLFSAEGDFVTPDMLVFSLMGVRWIEAKRKSVFSWHRQSQQWTTGIDLRHYGDYFGVLWRTKQPVWLLFYHESATPAACDLKWGCPESCPTGLFGGALLDLVLLESHRTPCLDATRDGVKGHGRSGMVYWPESALKRLASREMVQQAQQKPTSEVA